LAGELLIILKVCSASYKNNVKVNKLQFISCEILSIIIYMYA